MTTPLTDAQRELLAAAVAAPDDMGLAIEGAAIRTAKPLIKLGLCATLPPKYGSSRIAATEAGRAALNADLTTPDEPQGETAPPDDGPQPPTVEATRARKGKIANIIALLNRPQGALLGDMMSATGWQAHSVRGAMSGALKKKQGLTISSEKTDQGRVYRIVTPVADGAQ